MGVLYSTLKYLAVTLWSVFVIAPFLWAISTSFKDFQSVTNGATYIPWVDFEPTFSWAFGPSGHFDISDWVYGPLKSFKLGQLLPRFGFYWHRELYPTVYR